jgi:transketolase
VRDAFVAALSELAASDPSVMLITGDLGFGVLTAYAERFPKQFLNAGVAEQNMTGLAAGLALEGHKVYTYSIANFTTLRCLEQIRNDVCYHDADVTVVSVGGGFSYGQLGMSHFATEDLAILRALPSIMVVAPSDAWEATQLVRQMHQRPGPKYLRLDKGNAGLEEPAEAVRLGESRVVREGTDVTLVAIGAILSDAMTAACQLGEYGVSARVIAVHSIKPLHDTYILQAARETRALITVEEHSIIGGLGGAVAETCLHSGVAPQAFRAVGLRDCYPSVVGDQQYLRRAYGMDAGAIKATALALLNP